MTMSLSMAAMPSLIAVTLPRRGDSSSRRTESAKRRAIAFVASTEPSDASTTSNRSFG
jgi:hypothetical protein